MTVVVPHIEDPQARTIRNLVAQTDPDATATDAEALRHLLASLHERLIYADDALALGAIKHIQRLEAAARIRAAYIDDAGHRYTDCEAGNCRCGYAELRVWS